MEKEDIGGSKGGKEGAKDGKEAARCGRGWKREDLSG